MKYETVSTYLELKCPSVSAVLSTNSCFVVYATLVAQKFNFL